MLNKKIGLKTALFIGLVAGLSSSLVSAVSFSVNLSGTTIQALSKEAIAKNMSSVHFVDHENDFGGFIYWSSIDNLDNIDNNENIEENPNCVGHICGERVWIESDHTGYVCTQQVKGFYYDSQRGERLFPIDTGTAASWHDFQLGLTTEGGIYTNCINKQLADALEQCSQGGNADDEDEDDENEDDENEDDEDVNPYEEQCEAEARAAHGSYGYYGMVTHSYYGKNFGLIIGTNYQVNGETGWVSVDESLADTLIRYNNKYPVGFVYDYHGGVGFLGCEFGGQNKTSALHALIGLLNAGSGLQDLFSISDEDILVYAGSDPSITLDCSNISKVDLIQLVIEGLVGMGKESNLNIIGNQTNPKMQFFKSDYVDNTDLINYAKKKGESLCRGKWLKGEQGYDSRFDGYKTRVYNATWDSAGELVLPDFEGLGRWYNYYSVHNNWLGNLHGNWTGNYLYCIDLSNSTNNKKTIFAEPGYTYVVKGGNVVVTPMEYVDDDNYNYDVYILDGGDLVLDSAGLSYKKIFTKNGFIDPTNAYANGENSKQTYQSAIHDGGGWNYNDDYTAFGAFIKGNFVINGHLRHICDVLGFNCNEDGEGHINNRYFVYGKITTKDSLEELKNLFSWRCTNGVSSDEDERYCPQNNNYENAFMVVIDQDYDSPLF